MQRKIHKKKKRGQHTEDQNLVAPSNDPHFNNIPPTLQAKAISDARFQTAQRRLMMREIQQVAGNQAVQRDVLDDIGEWFRNLFSADPEDVVENLDSALDHAHTIVEAAEGTTVDPTHRRRLRQVADHLEGLQRVTGGIVDVLETAEAINQVEEFVDALNDIPENISDNPEAAADAFGRLFASAGELGGLLPDGPWSPYFTWLSGARNFFTDMLRGLDPGRRWRREFEMIERERGPNVRGM